MFIDHSQKIASARSINKVYILTTPNILNKECHDKQCIHQVNNAQTWLFCNKNICDNR